jgi:hypothetical protein
MTLSAKVGLICFAGLVVPPVFDYLGAYELAFVASAIIAACWLGVVTEAWIDFGRPGPRLLLSAALVLFWPSYLLVAVSACWVGVGCQ